MISTQQAIENTIQLIGDVASVIVTSYDGDVSRKLARAIADSCARMLKDSTS